MWRASLPDLAAARYDVLVIGGGIYGAMAAREAALRGLRTALVERDDFGGGTSHNSLKTIHGGIRYVQHLDFARLRASARERTFWLRAAPDLVRPLEFAIPLVGHGLRGPGAFAAVAALYGLGSAGTKGRGWPGARVVGRRRAAALLGDLAPGGLTGAGLWCDGQVSDTNRLLLATLRAATASGADIANYVEAETLIGARGRVVGARLRDRIDGGQAEIRARVTLCCAGPATGALAGALLGDAARARFPRFARAMNLVLDRPAGARALGVISRAQADAVLDRGGRMYFLVPWQGRMMIGTHEAPHRDDAPGDAPGDDRADSAAFLAAIDAVCPELALGPGDVLHVHRGLIPADADDARSAVQRQTRGTLIDHRHADGTAGLISCVGVKYTTARLVAERMLGLAQSQLGADRAGPVGIPAREGAWRSFATPLPVTPCDPVDPADPGALAARIRAAMREEMAMSLDDVLWRRCLLGETGALRGAGGDALWRRAERIAAPLGLPNRILPPVETAGARRV
ncbi:FAD-dependent oxidoreductase [Limimaricola hongkongensis]|uniref:FAD dependent oxidoreductase n=1 Tax=Limimaricola hongkongensis DSM 17492 TaxID=1122180 RepID=A0A017H745_9RHOB|nr:FAD-dependent oxidoreductase [Limimaricola hongkongensis]EYD70367.1 FAD dependent oxidoreductase [Limimaricola hongkongensis DSM 17492]